MLVAIIDELAVAAPWTMKRFHGFPCSLNMAVPSMSVLVRWTPCAIAIACVDDTGVHRCTTAFQFSHDNDDSYTI